MLELPVLLANADTINLIVDPRSILEVSLATNSNARDLDTRLCQWFDRISAAVPGELYHARLSTQENRTDDTELGKVFPVAFDFPSIFVAQSLLYYWAGIVIVRAQLCKTHEKLSALQGILAPIRSRLPCTCVNSAELASCCLQHFGLHLQPHLGTELEWPHKAALDICHSMEYCLQNSNKMFAPVAALPVLPIVKAYWRCCPGDWTRETAWIDEVIMAIGGNQHGLSMYALM